MSSINSQEPPRQPVSDQESETFDMTEHYPRLPQRFVRSLTEEAQQLLRESSLTECMSFIYNTGYGTCTKHCCQVLRNGQLPEMFGPALDPELSPKNIDGSTKISQWFIPNMPRLRSDGYTDAADVQTIVPLISKFWEVKCQDDARGKSIINSLTEDAAWLPHNILDRISVERFAYANQRAFLLLDPAMVRRERDLRSKRKATHKFWEDNILFSLPPVWLSDMVFWSRPAKGFDELSKAYLAWRKVWYLFVFRPDPKAIPLRIEFFESSLKPIIPFLHLWGNVQNDYNLYHYQELTRKDLRYTYEQEPEALRYILENLSYWKEECQTLNDYVGLRREMPRNQFHSAKRAAQRAGTAMDNLLQAEEALKKTMCNANKCIQQQKFYIAKQRFLEIQLALFEKPIPGGRELAELIKKGLV
ncbi:hypothetical protein EDB80DRAFT_886061 [Ilyonectria destructans]|nr:hypothetical protein EDB80DRAFT_886061 [Ilyonectria destructans]